jgi:hypothetical protein
MTPPGNLAEAFALAFRNALQARASEARVEWSCASGRTHAVKGNAQDRENSLMADAFRSLGFTFNRGGQGGRENRRIFSYEWNQKDIVAVDGLDDMWDRACWRGRYHYEIVCELENRISEFDLTMRGMLDLRSHLYAGIFVTDDPDPDVGEATWNRQSSRHLRLSGWMPPRGATTDYPWSFSDGEQLLAILIRESYPEVSRALYWTASDNCWSDAKRISF